MAELYGGVTDAAEVIDMVCDSFSKSNDFFGKLNWVTRRTSLFLLLISFRGRMSMESWSLVVVVVVVGGALVLL